MEKNAFEFNYEPIKKTNLEKIVFLYNKHVIIKMYV